MSVGAAMLGRERARTEGWTTLALVAHAIHDEGGMERAFAELIRRMPAHARVTVVSAELAESLRDLVEWERVAVPRRPFPVRFLLFFALGGLRLRSVQCDLVHTLGAIVPNRADAAEVQFCHAGFVRTAGALAPPGTAGLRWLNTALTRVLSLAAERWCYRPSRLRRFVAVSDAIGSELARDYSAIPYVVAPNGADLDRYRPDAMARRELRAELGLPDDDVVALFVGGDWDRKGLSILVEALASAESLRLWVVGSGDEATIQALARRVHVLDRITFFGRRHDTERFYAASDIFCLPSLYEAHPLVALEAAASGLPLVVSSVNGVVDLVGPNEAGRLVERSPVSVGAALAELAADPALRRVLGASARKRAEGYSWDASAKVVLKTYDALASGRAES
jgi:UDP-glucose:(heptosyl)LPS alpha-1,3-glucosyltransferase